MLIPVDQGRPQTKAPEKCNLGFHVGSFCVRLARTAQEIQQFQALRYLVFVQEWGARLAHDHQREWDAYDDVCDHLVVVDETIQQVIGGYRLTRREHAQAVGQFMCENEYVMTPIVTSGLCVAELSRACVHPQYRSRGVMALLWRGMAQYFRSFAIDVVFGAVSFPGVDAYTYAQELSYLHHYHLAPRPYRPYAYGPHAVSLPLTPMPDDPREAASVFHRLPALVKGYARLGGWFAQGAFVDHSFGSVDMCVVLRTDQLTQRYAAHYDRHQKSPMK